MSKVYDPVLCMLVDKPEVKTRDTMVTDDIEDVLKNFNKSSDFGDSVKVSLSNGKTAIVQKEYDGWYASVDGKRIKGSLQVIIGFLKSSSRDSAPVDKAIKTCDDNEAAVRLFNKGLVKIAEAIDLFYEAQNKTDNKKIISKCSEMITKLHPLTRA